MRHAETDYWSKSSQLRCDGFTQTMPRNKFQKIKGYLHAADNQNLDASKMAKVKPLYDLINSLIIRFGIFHDRLSIDESMVPYFGRHSCKQFIRSKPIRFGYKIWALCSSTGLPYKLEIYQGKVANENGPLGSRVVNNLLSVCETPANHHVFMDNFFTSYDLLAKLKLEGFRATGTVRENRLKKCPLVDASIMKKKPRGSFDYQSDSVVTAVRWNDNLVVTICSNAIGVKPLKKVNRCSKGAGA